MPIRKPQYPFPEYSGRLPRNITERKFFRGMKKRGWSITKRGWPDFICFRKGKLILVEVKPTPGRRGEISLKWDQRFLMGELSKRGILCYQWNPVTGFQRIKPKKS